MINFDALNNAKKTKLYIIKEATNIKLWKVVVYNDRPYYAIIKIINVDSSMTIIKEKLRMAIRTFNKLKKEEKYETYLNFYIQDSILTKANGQTSLLDTDFKKLDLFDFKGEWNDKQSKAIYRKNSRSSRLWITAKLWKMDKQTSQRLHKRKHWWL